MGTVRRVKFARRTYKHQLAQHMLLVETVKGGHVREGVVARCLQIRRRGTVALDKHAPAKKTRRVWGNLTYVCRYSREVRSRRRCIQSMRTANLGLEVLPAIRDVDGGEARRCVGKALKGNAD